jgi:hypothetical protein
MVSPFRELTEAALRAIEREVAASETLSRWALAVGRLWGLGCAPAARHCSPREPTPGSYTGNPSAS